MSKKRYVDEGVITSAGFLPESTWALYADEELLGPEVSDDTARYMEY